MVGGGALEGKRQSSKGKSESWRRNIGGLQHDEAGLLDARLAHLGDLVEGPQHLVRRLLFVDEPLLFEPGSAWEYGFSSDVLGFVVEAITGHTLGDYLRQTIWEPLGMRDTAFELTEANRARHARAFETDPRNT